MGDAAGSDSVTAGGTAPADPLDDDERDLWLDFLRVATRSLDRLDRDLQDLCGWSLADYEICVALSEAPGRRLVMADLAARAYVSSSRLTYRVGRLERDGLIRREPSDDDGRRVWAVLTDAGLTRLREAYPTHLAGVRRYVVDAPRPSDRPALHRSLDAMLTALGGEPDARQP